MLFAFDTLKALQKKGHRLILWTFRTGKHLEEAISFCRQNGVEFYAVNRSFPEEEFSERISRKINADLFIDDRNFGGFPGWGEIFRHLHPEDGDLSNEPLNPDAHYNKQRKGFMGKLFRR